MLEWDLHKAMWQLVNVNSVYDWGQLYDIQFHTLLITHCLLTFSDVTTLLSLGTAYANPL